MTEPHYNELSGVKRQLFLVLLADEQEMWFVSETPLNMYFQRLDHYQIEPDYIQRLHKIVRFVASIPVVLNLFDFKTLLCLRQYLKALTSGAGQGGGFWGYSPESSLSEKTDSNNC